MSIKFSTFSLIQIILKIILIYFSLKFNIDNYIYIFPNIETQIAKNMPAMQETQVRSLGQEDSLEKGNGYPLQYSCLENSLDRGAWWATVHGIAKSQT